MTNRIKIEFAPESQSYPDAVVVGLWQAAHGIATPADREATRAAELIGQEIIRRWLAAQRAQPRPQLLTQPPPEIRAEINPTVDEGADILNALEVARKVVGYEFGKDPRQYRVRAIAAVHALGIAIEASQKIYARSI